MNVISVLTTGFGIVGFLGGAVGYLGKARNDALSTLQAREIEALTGSKQRLEKDNASLMSRNQALEQQVKDLQDIAQGSPELKRLTQEIHELREIIERRSDYDQRQPKT